MEKYLGALDKFTPAPADDAIAQTVSSIMERHFAENNTQEVRRFLYGCLDLTSLNPQDSKESIWNFLEKINAFEDEHPGENNVAAICVYPNFAAIVRESLTTDGVKIAVVSGGFPASQTFIEVKIAETSLAVADGAEEVDIVINLGYFFDKEYGEFCEEIQEIREVCKEQTLKVILETGLLKTAQNIKNASILSMYSGADFLKTSTGKNCEGASLEAVYVMCEAIKEYYALHNKQIGIKVAGGVKTADEAVKYYTIVREVLGKEWLTPKLFRIGASSLADNLL